MNLRILKESVQYGIDNPREVDEAILSETSHIFFGGMENWCMQADHAIVSESMSIDIMIDNTEQILTESIGDISSERMYIIIESTEKGILDRIKEFFAKAWKVAKALFMKLTSIVLAIANFITKVLDGALNTLLNTLKGKDSEKYRVTTHRWDVSAFQLFATSLDIGEIKERTGKSISYGTVVELENKIMNASLLADDTSKLLGSLSINSSKSFLGALEGKLSNLKSDSEMSNVNKDDVISKLGIDDISVGSFMTRAVISVRGPMVTAKIKAKGVEDFKKSAAKAKENLSKILDGRKDIDKMFEEAIKTVDKLKNSDTKDATKALNLVKNSITFGNTMYTQYINGKIKINRTFVNDIVNIVNTILRSTGNGDKAIEGFKEKSDD